LPQIRPRGRGRGLEKRFKNSRNQFKLHFQIALVRFSWTANSELKQDDAKIVKEPETVPVETKPETVLVETKIVKEPETVPVETKIVNEPETVPVETKIVKEPESLSRDNFMPPKKFRAKMLIPTWFL
jgi:hypothetical protein